MSQNNDVKSSTSSEIWLNSEFDNDSVLKVREKIIKESQLSPEKPIIVYINSYGGNVDSLNSLVDTFESLPNKIVTVCCGSTMSAGAVLLSAGEDRYITPNSRVMIHKVSTMNWGNADDIKNEAHEVERINNKLMQILAKNCKKSANQINKLLRDKRELYLSAEEALKFGIVDYIGFPELVEETTYKLKILNKKGK